MVDVLRYRERADTIRCIVASLVGDGESGDSLVDENEPIQPLQQMQVEDYTDPNWEPEPIDAGPGETILFLDTTIFSTDAPPVIFLYRFPHKQTK